MPALAAAVLMLGIGQLGRLPVPDCYRGGGEQVYGAARAAAFAA